MKLILLSVLVFSLVLVQGYRIYDKQQEIEKRYRDQFERDEAYDQVEDNDEDVIKLNSFSSVQGGISTIQRGLSTIKNGISAVQGRISRMEKAVKCLSSPGWMLYHSNCYHISKNKMLWKDAQRYCQGKGSNLASIHNSLENEYLRSELIRRGIGYAHLGLNDIQVEGKFQWNDGSKVDYRNWYTGEPNNVGGDEDCAMMYVNRTGKWNDFKCSRKDTKFHYVCLKN